jgi:hypothetical protein
MSIIKEGLTKYKVRLTFTDEVLGSLPGDPELHETYIASKAPDAPTKTEEIEQMGVGDMVEKGMTIFPPGRCRKGVCVGLPAPRDDKRKHKKYKEALPCF